MKKISAKTKDGKLETREELENEIWKKVAEQREREEVEKIAEQKRKKEEMRREIIEQQKLFEENEAKKKKEEMQLTLWEMQQRYYREKFDKDWASQQGQSEKNRRLAYGKLLKSQMVSDFT